MENHPYFNLKMHSDDEIRDLLKATLISRQTIHEWPLSCVQLLTTTSGERYIYKSQFGPTVESQFYARAESPLMTKAETLYHEEGYTVLLLDYIEGKLLEDQKYSPYEVIQIGKSLVDAISQIEGDLPCYCDISTIELFQEYVDRVLQVGLEFIKAGTFTRVTDEEISYLRKWACSPSVKGVFQEKVAVVHGDTTGDNVFITESGYKIIDWQRPIKAPSAIDLVALLESQDIESQAYVNPAVTGIFYFTRIAWAVECQSKWIPQATCYDDWIWGYIQKIKKTASEDRL